MNTKTVLRCGAVLAVAGALFQLAATITETDTDGPPQAAMRALVNEPLWTMNRLLDLTGVLLTVGGLAIASRTGSSPRSRDWFRAGRPFLLLMGALGASAVLVAAALKDLALAGARDDGRQAAYTVTFDTVRDLAGTFFFGAFLALGLYLATLAAALLRDPAYQSWMGWLAAVGAGLLLVGNPLQLLSDAAFVAVLTGYAAFIGVSIGVGVMMWQTTRSTGQVPHRVHAQA